MTPDHRRQSEDIGNSGRHVGNRGGRNDPPPQLPPQGTSVAPSPYTHQTTHGQAPQRPPAVVRPDEARQPSFPTRPTQPPVTKPPRDDDNKGDRDKDKGRDKNRGNDRDKDRDRDRDRDRDKNRDRDHANGRDHDRNDRDHDRRYPQSPRRPDSYRPGQPPSGIHGGDGWERNWAPSHVTTYGRRHHREFVERFRHGHLPHWHGYNRRSWSSLSIRCYDPFYFDCVYWGGHYYYWRGVTYPSWNSYYIWDYTYRPEPEEDAEPARLNPVPACFPPSAPPLGAPSPAAEILPADTVPEELRAHLNEPYYPVLAGRLLTDSLTVQQRRDLDSYRERRDNELGHLRRILAQLPGMDPATALARLEVFAQEQTPRLRALEDEAENLRRALVLDELARAQLRSVSWTVYREYFIARGASEADEASRLHLDYLTLRACAYYQDGLSRLERELLREAAGELQLKAYQARGGFGSLDPALAPVAFSPGGTSLSLPRGLPAEDAAVLSSYNTRKAALRQALVNRIRSLDTVGERDRRAALEAGARASAPAYAELEELAERLRPALYAHAELPGRRLEASALPQALADRVLSLVRSSSELADEYRQRFAELRQMAAPGQVRVLNLSADTPSNRTPPALTYVPELRVQEQRNSAMRREVFAFNEDMKARHRQLLDEEQSIRLEISRLGLPGDSGSLLEKESQAARRLLLGESHATYLQAALQPALSLEQRRLLFGACLAELNLPLPAAE